MWQRTTVRFCPWACSVFLRLATGRKLFGKYLNIYSVQVNRCGQLVNPIDVAAYVPKAAVQKFEGADKRHWFRFPIISLDEISGTVWIIN